MVTVRLPAKLTSDRRLIIQVPDTVDLMPGDVEVIIEQEMPAAPITTRAALLEKLNTAGLLSHMWDDEPDDPDAPAEYQVDIPTGAMARALEEDRDGRY